MATSATPSWTEFWDAADRVGVIAQCSVCGGPVFLDEPYETRQVVSEYDDVSLVQSTYHISHSCPNIVFAVTDDGVEDGWAFPW